MDLSSLTFLDYIHQRVAASREALYISLSYPPNVRFCIEQVLNSISAVSKYQAVHIAVDMDEALNGMLLVFDDYHDFLRYMEKYQPLAGLVTKALNPSKGVGLVLVSDKLNSCWQRFTVIKEASHLLFEEDKLSSVTDVGALARALVDTLAIPDNSHPDYELRIRDNAGILAAIELLMPESIREWMTSEVNVKNQTSYSIATHLRLPVKFVEFKMQKWDLLNTAN